MRPVRGTLFVLLSLIILGHDVSAWAQDSFFERYKARRALTLRDQPHWATPLITTAPRLEEGFRTDFVHQNTTGRQSSWSYGDAKGLQLITSRHVELRFSPPSFFTHSGGKARDGFGDVGFRLKYRVYGSDEGHHNAIVTGMIGATVPTGKNGNGSCCAVLAPTVELGKGFGKMVFITSAGGSLPVSNTKKLGRQVALNNAILYHAAKLLWFETEFNTTLYKGGKNDGKTQTFVTPGLIVSRIPLQRQQTQPATIHLTLGLGEQIALTHASTYNHAAVFTGRVRF